MKSFFKAVQAGNVSELQSLLAQEGFSKTHRYLGVPAQQWAEWLVPALAPGPNFLLVVRRNEIASLEFIAQLDSVRELGFVSLAQQHISGLRLAKLLVGYARILHVFRLNRFVSMKYSQDAEAALSLNTESRLALMRLEDPYGFGVIALQHIKAEQVITEYLGLVKCEHKTSLKGDTTYVMEYPLPSCLGWIWTIDARESGNIARFINHSRKPNAVMEVFYDGRLMRLAIVALRSIAVNEQITLNYGASYWLSRSEQL